MNLKLTNTSSGTTVDASTDDTRRYCIGDLRGAYRVRLFERETEVPLSEPDTNMVLCARTINVIHLTTAKPTGEVRRHRHRREDCART